MKRAPLPRAGPILAVGWIVYRINQRCVRTKLKPLRDELADICESLEDDSSASSA